MACSVTLSLFNAIDDDLFDSGSHRLSFVIVITGSILTSGFSFYASKYAQRHMYVDWPCRQSYSVAIILLQISTGIYISSVAGVFVFPFIVVLIEKGYLGTFASKAHKVLKSYSEHGGSIVFGCFLFSEVVMVISSFALIMVIREKARTLFGSSYDDNALGYGQIIAVGFCLQTIVDGCRLLFSKTPLRSETTGHQLSSSETTKAKTDAASTNSASSHSTDSTSIHSQTADDWSTLNSQSIDDSTSINSQHAHDLVPQPPARSRTSNMESGKVPQSTTNVVTNDAATATGEVALKSMSLHERTSFRTQ